MINDYNWFFDNLKNKINFCYVRFNDGEMMGIHRIGSVAARGDQVVDKSLHDKLIDGISHRQKDYYIGIPCSLCFPKYSKLAKQMTDGYENVTSAVLLTNKNWKTFYDNFPSACKDRKIVWIGGKSQSKERLLDYGLDIKKMIRVNETNSWSFYDKLKKAIPSLITENDVVVISLGPTARVLCKELFEKYPNVTFIDIGSTLDPVTKGVYFSAHKGWEETGFNLQKRCSECN